MHLIIDYWHHEPRCKEPARDGNLIGEQPASGASHGKAQKENADASRRAARSKWFLSFVRRFLRVLGFHISLSRSIPSRASSGNPFGFTIYDLRCTMYASLERPTPDRAPWRPLTRAPDRESGAPMTRTSYIVNPEAPLLLSCIALSSESCCSITTAPE